MNEKNTDSTDEERDARLLEALLERTLQPRKNDESRISELMVTVRGESESSGEPTSHTTSPHTPRRHILRWLSVPLAASVVATIFFVTGPGNSGHAAMAALDRSLQAEQNAEVREYAVSIMSRNLLGGSRIRQHQLFVRKEEFAVCTSALIGQGKIWAGGTDNEQWLVPRLGPVLIGRNAVASLKSDVLQTPFLSVEPILQRTRRFYDLSFESNVEVTVAGSSELCDRITGTRIRSPRMTIPERVEVFINPATGFAVRIRLQWAQGDDSRWTEATAELVGTVDVGNDFFRHTGHHDGDRPIINSARSPR